MKRIKANVTLNSVLILRATFKQDTCTCSKMNTLDNGTQINCTTFFWSENKLTWPSRIRPSRHVVPENLTDDPRLKRPTGKADDKICLSRYPMGTIIPQNRKNNTVPIHGQRVAFCRSNSLPKGVSRHQIIERNFLNKQRSAEAARAKAVATKAPKGSINVRISVPNPEGKRQKTVPAEAAVASKANANCAEPTPVEAVEAGREVAPSNSAAGLLANEQSSAIPSDPPDKGHGVQSATKTNEPSRGNNSSNNDTSSNDSSSSSSESDSDNSSSSSSSSSNSGSSDVEGKQTANNRENKIQELFGSDTESTEGSTSTPITGPGCSSTNAVDNFLAQAKEPLPRDTVDLNLYGPAPVGVVAEAPTVHIDLAALVADLGEPSQFQHGLASDTETASEGETLAPPDCGSVESTSHLVNSDSIVRAITPPATPAVTPAVKVNQRNRRRKRSQIQKQNNKISINTGVKPKVASVLSDLSTSNLPSDQSKATSAPVLPAMSDTEKMDTSTSTASTKRTGEDPAEAPPRQKHWHCQSLQQPMTRRLKRLRPLEAKPSLSQMTARA